MTLKPERASELVAQRIISNNFGIPLRNYVDKPDNAAFVGIGILAVVVGALLWIR